MFIDIVPLLVTELMLLKNKIYITWKCESLGKQLIYLAGLPSPVVRSNPTRKGYTVHWYTIKDEETLELSSLSNLSTRVRSPRTPAPFNTRAPGCFGSTKMTHFQIRHTNLWEEHHTTLSVFGELGQNRKNNFTLHFLHMDQEGLLYATCCGHGLWVCLPLIAACFYGFAEFLQFKCFHLALCPHPSDFGHPGQMKPGSMGQTTHHFSTQAAVPECEQKRAIWTVTFSSAIYVTLHAGFWFTYCIKLTSSQCLNKVC